MAAVFTLAKACLALSFIITEQRSGRGSSPTKVKEGITRGGKGGGRWDFAAVVGKIDGFMRSFTPLNNFFAM